MHVLFYLIFWSASLSTAPSPFEIAEPTKVPKVFYQGSLSRDAVQWNNYFAKNGHEVYYTIQGKNRSYLVMQAFEGKGYGPLQPLAFDSAYIYSDVWVNEEGNHMQFMSTIPHPETGATDFNLWQSRRVNKVWQKPTLVSEATAEAGNEGYPCLTRSGNQYFAVARDGSRNSDIHVVRPGESTSAALPGLVNTTHFEGDAFIDPDEEYMIFAAFDTPDSQGLSDLQISFNSAEGWSKPKALTGFNSTGYDGSPYVSPDGRYLIFTSSRASTEEGPVVFNHYIVRFNKEDYR